MKRIGHRLLLGLGLGFAALSARAEAPVPLPVWELGGGIGTLIYPDYRGARHDNIRVLPVPYGVYRGDRLRLARDGLKARLLESDRLQLTLSVAASLPGDDDAGDSPRAGMPDLLSTFEMGPSLDYDLNEPQPDRWNWRLRLPVRAVGATDFRRFENAGWLAHPYLDTRRHIRLGRDWDLRLSASVGGLWASRRYHEYFYEVDPQYVTPERPAYQASGGYSGARASVYAGIGREKWRLGVGLLQDWLDGAAFVDSPLVETRTARVIGVFFAYRFWTSSETVATDDEVQ